MLGALAALDGVSRSALLERVMRGRLWIGLLACALVGVVAMQLVVLKLNAGIGTTLEREAALERDNAQLSVENSTFSGENRIGPLAAASGMTLAPAGSVHFLAAGSAYVSHAVGALTNTSTVQAPTSQSTATGTTAPSSESGESTESSEASGPSSTPTSSASEEVTSSSDPSTATSTTAEAPAEGTQTNSEATPSTSSSGATSAGESPQAVSGPGGGTEAG